MNPEDVSNAETTLPQRQVLKYMFFVQTFFVGKNNQRRKTPDKHEHGSETNKTFPVENQCRTFDYDDNEYLRYSVNKTFYLNKMKFAARVQFHSFIQNS